MIAITHFEKKMALKTRLLVHGCAIDKEVEFPNAIHLKQILLYAHSDAKVTGKIPDDIILENGEHSVTCRIRYQPDSPLKIVSSKGAYSLLDGNDGTRTPLNFLPIPNSNDSIIDKKPLRSICSYLGDDLLGIIPSNYCFYFGNKKECRFCEIWGTFKDNMNYRKTFKSKKVIYEAIKTALELDPRIKHLAVTSGNIKSYDFTSEYFAEIGKALSELESFDRLDHKLATLMPPDDFELIKNIKDSGFNKIYYPLEVFEREFFEVVCPGKHDYGYDRLLNGLEYARKIFGEGHVYTNFVYGIQSLDKSLDPKSYDPERENEKCLIAVDNMLERGITPVFTLYHYGGYNHIGNIPLDHESTFTFFKELGERVLASGIIPDDRDSIIFSRGSLTNTIFNEGFLLAKKRKYGL